MNQGSDRVPNFPPLSDEKPIAFTINTNSGVKNVRLGDVLEMGSGSGINIFTTPSGLMFGSDSTSSIQPLFKSLSTPSVDLSGITNSIDGTNSRLNTLNTRVENLHQSITQHIQNTNTPTPSIASPIVPSIPIPQPASIPIPQPASIPIPPIPTLLQVLTKNGMGPLTEKTGINKVGISSFQDGDGSHVEGVNNMASGFASHSEGLNNESDGKYAHSEGYGTLAHGDSGHSEGIFTDAWGIASHAEGNDTIAFGDYAHSEGTYTQAKGIASHAEGKNVIVTGDYSHGGGEGNLVSGSHSLVQGSHLTTNDDYIYLFGRNGVSFPLPPSIQISDGNSSNESVNGFGVGMIMGSLNSMSTCSPLMSGANTGGWLSRGADYAEYFEWFDGNTGNEDRVGYFVSLVGKKIKEAVSSSDTMGIVSGCPAFIGDYSIAWPSMYLLDNVGRRIEIKSYIEPLNMFLFENKLPTFHLTDVIKYQTSSMSDLITLLPNYDSNIMNEIKDIAPIVTHQYNPLYDPSKTYISRSQRMEWATVGLVGKLYVKDDGTCVVNDKCSCQNGIAVPGTDWQVMARVSPTTILILFR
jgi:trimeric autotransporter adhesin